jgi:WD40 repeat protein
VSIEYASTKLLILGLMILHRAHWEQDLVEGDGSHPTILESTIKGVHDGNILSVAIHTLGSMKIIATGSGDKSVKFIDVATGEVVKTVKNHKAGVLSIDFHPLKPNLMVTTSMDATSIITDINTDTIVQAFSDHGKFVIRGIFSPDGLWYASASYDRTLNVYSWSNEHGYQLARKFGPLVGNVEAICFLPDSLTLVAGVRDDNYLHYISLRDFSDTRHNMNSNGDDWVSFTPMWLSVSPNGKYLLVSTDDSNGRVILFGINSSVQLRNFYGAATDMLSSAPRHCWDPSGKYVYIAGGNDCCIRVIEVKTGKVAYQLTGHTAMIRSLAFDETVGLASTGFDRTVRLWRSEDATMR